MTATLCNRLFRQRVEEYRNGVGLFSRRDRLRPLARGFVLVFRFVALIFTHIARLFVINEMVLVNCFGK